MESGRVCNRCNIFKDKENFSFLKKKNRLYSTCKKCVCEKVKAKYWENPEHFKKKAKEYRDKDVIKARNNWSRWHKNERINHPVRVLLRRARRRSREQNLEFNLEENDIIIPTNCPILGIELKVNCSKNKLPTDNSISLDRINNSKGYTKDNVLVISMKANRIKNNSTFEEVEKLYLFLKNLKEIS